MERGHVRADGNHAGAGGIERNRLDTIPRDVRCFERRAHGLGQCPQLIRVALGRVIGIVVLAQQRIVGRRRTEAAFFTIDNRHSD